MEGAAEKYITLKQAASALGFPYWKLQRAAKLEMIPTYTFFNRRKYVRLSEIVAFLRSQGKGAGK